jgi:hypothetical protein
MQTHKDEEIGALIGFDGGDDVIRTGVADIVLARFESLAYV